MNYLIKYVTKIDKDHEGYKSKILTSAGIGGSYMKRTDWRNNKYVEGKTEEGYRTDSGYKVAMPIYWRNKIYSEEEREKLWIEKLDKEERWVCGERVSIKEGTKEYTKLVEWYRIKNKELGYGDDGEWNKREYEKQSTMIRHAGRIKANHLAGGAE